MHTRLMMRAVLPTLIAALLGVVAGSWRAPRPEAERVGEKAATFATPIAPEKATVAAPLPAADSRPVRERLREVVRSRNRLGGAATAQALLAGLTLEDFREFASQPKEFPFPSNDIFGRSYMDALVRRWLAVDPDGAAAAMQALDEALVFKREAQTTSTWVGHGLLPEALARLRAGGPEAVAEALSVAEKLIAGAHWSDFMNKADAAFEQLARTDPAHARALAGQIPDMKDRIRAQGAVQSGSITATDPVEVARIARDSRTVSNAFAAAARIGPVSFRATLEATTWKISCTALMAEGVMRNPDAAWETVPPELARESKSLTAGSASEAQSLARSLSPRDRERALATADRLQGAWRTPVLEPLVSAWAAAEPRAAIEWVAQNDNRSGVALAALGPWLVSDSAAAVAWADGTAPPELRQALGAQLVRALAADEADRQKPMGYASLFRSASAEDKAISEALLQHSPATAARWIAEMPATQSAGTAFKPIFENWLDRDATAAAQWIEALPASRRRDEATAAFATAAASRDVESAAHWVPTIADQTLRQNAAESVFRALDARDPAAARSWLRTVADLDEQWLERTLKPR